MWERTAVVPGGMLLMIASVEADYRDNCVHYLRLVFLQSCCCGINGCIIKNLTGIEAAPIDEQVNVSQVLNSITSNPENLTAADVSTSVAILTQLTMGATMDTTVSV